METADDAVLEAFCLYLRPVLDLVAGDVLGVAGHVEAGVGVCPAGADGGHQLVVFIGDGIFGRFVRDAVDAGIDGLAFEAVRGLAVDFKLLLDLVEQGFLYFVVLRAEMAGAFEHQVLEVVCQSGGLGRVVLSTYAHGDVGLYARCLFVDGHVDLQPVVQRVDAGLQWVVVDCLVAVLRGTTAQAYRCQYGKQEADLSE